MIEGKLIDAVLTDDESELVTIINGLEEQAIQLEGNLEKTKNEVRLFMLGAATGAGLTYLEKGTNERLEYLTVSVALVIGGFERLYRERKMIKSIRSKNLLAYQLTLELEPTDLERYEERYELDFDNEDDDEFDEDDFLFT